MLLGSCASSDRHVSVFTEITKTAQMLKQATMKLNWTRYTVILSSFILCLAGLAAFFIPERGALFLGEESAGELLIQLYGASLLGFGFANWNIRHAAVGGIYGRAVVTGNIIHFLAGTSLLLGMVLGGQTHIGIIAAFAVYLLLAVGYIAVLFSGGVKKRDG
jgi:hypothetical protein